MQQNMETPNSGKIILDLCGGTAAWSAPYKNAGYTVYNITLPKYDVTMAHLDPVAKLHIVFPYASPQKQGRATFVGDEIPLSRIHGILAAPPCTMFSIARNMRAKKPRDLGEGMKVVQACLEIIWLCRAYGALEWWAMENPTGLLRQFLGIPPLRFEQWQYGDDGIKPTDIWGYYKIPRKTHSRRHLFVKSKDQSGVYRRYGHKKAAELYATTPPLFARAFFKANP